MSSNIVGISGNTGSGKDTVADKFVAEGYVKISLADPMKRLASKVFCFSEPQLWGPSGYRNQWDERFFIGADEWRSSERRLHAESMPWLRELMPSMGEDVLYDAQKSLIDWFTKLRRDHPDLSPRVCLQLLGTEWGREACDEDVWVDLMSRTAERLLESKEYAYDRLFGLHWAESSVPAGVVVPDVRFENELLFFKRNNCSVIKVVRPGTDGAAVSTGITQHKSETEQAGFDPSLFSVTIENEGTLEDLLTTATVLAEAYSTAT